MPDRRSPLLLPHPPPLQRILRGLVRRWYLGLVAALAAALVTPWALLAIGTSRARACLASYEAPRGPALPDCLSEMRWFITPSRIPWTSIPARYRAEELSMRAAVAAYDDATVGHPDEAAQRRAADALAAAQATMKKGSQRLALEELGRAVGAPDPGRSAMLAGDRRTLRSREIWDHWSVDLRTLEAMLLDGEVERAGALARLYADFDVRDEDLRVDVAAMLCLSGDAARGKALLETVQGDRAHQRHESWARNWGEVRVAIVACAAKAGEALPPAPERAEGGDVDLPEVRAAQRLRLFAERGEGDTQARREAAFHVIQMLKAGPLAPGARVPVVAALLGSGHGVDASLLADLSRPRVADGEPALVSAAHALTALEWIAEPRRILPSPSRGALRDAAEELQRKAASPDASAEERLALEQAAATTAIEAVRAFALAGDGESAARIVDRAGERALPSEAARALCRSSAWYVAGDPARALAELEHEPADLAHEAALRTAWWIQKAELYASAGRRDEAARAAVLADEEATLLGDRALEVRALWTRLALVHATQAPDGAARASALTPLRAEPPPPLPGERVWPWVGEMATPSSWLAPGAESPAALSRALGFWETARRASPEDRRAIRYAAFGRHRGDAPEAFPEYLALAGELLHPDEGDVEVWLDAFAATSSRRLTLRAYAWARAEAARFRGDAAAAARWAGRYRALATLAAGPGNAELAAVLGI